MMNEQYTEQQDTHDSKEAEKKRSSTREGQKQDSFWGDEDLVKEFQEYVKEHGFVKTEVYEGMIRRWLDRQKNGIDTGEYRQSSLDFETILAQAQRMFDESLGARSVLVKAHKEQIDAINAARLAAEADAKRERAERENLLKRLSEAESARDDAVVLKEQFKVTYEDWKRRAEEAQEAKIQAEAKTEALTAQYQSMDKDLLKTRTELEKISAEKELYSDRIKNLESALKEEKLGRKADAEMAEKRQQEAVKTTLESAKIDLRVAVAEQRDRDADRLEEERQKHADIIAAMQEKIDLARQNQGKAETELNAVIRLKSETEAELQRTQEALAKVLGEK